MDNMTAYFLLLFVAALFVGASQANTNGVYHLDKDFIECYGMSRPEYDRVVEKVAAYKKALANQLHTTYVPHKETPVIDDIIFTEADMDALMEELEPDHGRAKRNALNELSSPNFKWTFPIKISFDGSHTAAEVQVIQRSMTIWEAQTCVRFNDVGAATPDIVFTRGSNTGCGSYIGNVSINPQLINLAAACLSFVGTSIHEIGHSLGLYHMHQRTDRDEFVTIFLENVISGAESNFRKYAEHLIVSYGIPYDYTSVMHYNNRAFSSQTGALTVQAVKEKFRTSLGQRQELTFRDAKIINLVYCQDICLSSPPLACPGESYQDPNDCTRCVCPDGLAGTLCDTVADSSPVCGLAKTPLQATDSEQCFYSPLFAQNVPQNTFCYWQIQADPGKVVAYKMKQLALVCSGSTPNKYCSVDWVEVKDQSDAIGQRWCCDADLNVYKQLNTDKVIISMKKFFTPTMLSFELCYKQVDDPNTTPAPPTTTESTPVTKRETTPATTTPAAPDCSCAAAFSRSARVKCAFTVQAGLTKAESCLNTPGCCWERRNKRGVPKCYKPSVVPVYMEVDCSTPVPFSQRVNQGWKGITPDHCACVGGCFDEDRPRRQIWCYQPSST